MAASRMSEYGPTTAASFADMSAPAATRATSMGSRLDPGFFVHHRSRIARNTDRSSIRAGLLVVVIRQVTRNLFGPLTGFCATRQPHRRRAPIEALIDNRERRIDLELDARDGKSLPS